MNLSIKRRMFAMAFVLVPAAAAAQGTLSKGLARSGMQTVFVLDDRGVETTGKLVSLDDEAAVLLVGSDERRFELGRITRISRRGDSLRNGAIIGALVGAVTGALAASVAECSDERGRIGGCGAGMRTTIVTLSTAFYAAVGTGIDALVQGRTVVYRAPAVRLAARPGGASIGVTLRW